MRLAEWRKAQNLTLAQLGEMLGISEAHASKIERGLSIPRPQLMAKISATTNEQVSPASFYGHAA